jgi:hypothetical protein
MLFFRYTGRDYLWIIILVTYAPDLEKIADSFLSRIGFTVLFDGHTIHHGTFHMVAVMLFFSILLAFLFHPLGIRFVDTPLFSVIGFGARLVEDALIYLSNYKYLWPFINEKVGLGWLLFNGSDEDYLSDFFHIANTDILVTGLLLHSAVILIRTWVEGTAWIRWYMPERLYRHYFARNKT